MRTIILGNRNTYDFCLNKKFYICILFEILARKLVLKNCKLRCFCVADSLGDTHVFGQFIKSSFHKISHFSARHKNKYRPYTVFEFNLFPRPKDDNQCNFLTIHITWVPRKPVVTENSIVNRNGPPKG